MIIHGLNKTTLLDYPGHLAAAVFTGGCNFRCPFCHNSGLVLAPDNEPAMPDSDLFAFLTKRQGLLEGVCVSGGEPLLQADLSEFLYKVKKLGYLVKLDTNGFLPDTLKQLYEDGLIDYTAMDIKSSPENYSSAAGIPNLDFSRIQDSVDFLMKQGQAYEFRTTLVKELHTEKDIRSIGLFIKGCSAYYLQPYKDCDTVICPGFTSFSKKEMQSFQKILLKTIKKVEIRGID